MNDFVASPKPEVDPYESVIDHYGEMRHAYWMEIGLNRYGHNFTREFNQASFNLSEASPAAYNNRVISFELINNTGNIPQVSRWGEQTGVRYEDTEGYWGSQRINWNADDTFTDTFSELFESVQERIETSEKLLDLRAQDTWTREDRVMWEREISTIISEEMDEIPGLGDYRHVAGQGITTDIEAESRALFLNELSIDIEDGTTRIEFDCEAMSALEGSILQRIDELYLPVTGQNEGDYKMAFNYFYANGEVNWGAHDQNIGGHAFIISSATGNIIEATIDPDNLYGWEPYTESSDPNFSFEDFVRGDTFIGDNGWVYGGDISAYIQERDAPAPEAIQPVPHLPPLNPNGA